MLCGDFDGSEWYKAVMGSLLGEAGGHKEPGGIGRFHRAARGQLCAVAVW